MSKPPLPAKPARPTFAPGQASRGEWVLFYVVFAVVVVGFLAVVIWRFSR